MEHTPTEQRRFSFDPTDGTLAISAQLMKQEWRTLLVPSFIFMAVGVLTLSVPLADLIGGSGLSGRFLTTITIAYLLLLVLWVSVRCVVMVQVTAFLRGAQEPSAASYRLALRHLPKAVGASLLASAITGAWYILLIIPGIISGMRNSFVLPTVLFENAGWVSAFDNSREVTRGHFWPLIWAGMVGQILGWAAMIAAFLLFGSVVRDAQVSVGDILPIAILFLAWPLIGTFTSVHRAIQYWQLTAELRRAEWRVRGPSPFTPPSAAPAS